MNLKKKGISPRFSLVVPLFNEAHNAGKVYRAMKTAMEGLGEAWEMILVNNGSSDETGAICQDLAATDPHVRVVTVAVNQGYGWGIQQGLAVAEGEFLGYTDGDTQVPPEAVGKVFSTLKDSGADLCKGIREARHDGWNRRAVSWIYNRLFLWLFNLDTADINAKPKAFTRAFYGTSPLVSRDWFIDAEIMLRTRGRRVVEIPFTFQRRDGGRSHVRWTTVVEFLKNMWEYWRKG